VLKRVFAFLFVGLLLFCCPQKSQAQTTVLVNSFENQTSDRSLDWIGEGLAALIGERLTAQKQLYVFSNDERGAEYERLGIPESVPISRATAMRIAWDIGADVLITGRISGTHEEFRIDARILDLGESRTGGEISVSARLDEVISMAATLASRLSKELIPGSALPESDYASRPPVPRSAFEAYVRGILAPEPQRRMELLQNAIRLHPQYTAATYELGQSYYLDSNYEASTNLLEKTPADAPEYAQARYMLGMNAYHLGDFAKASAIFSALPPTYDVLINLGAALAGKGDSAAAEASWRRAANLDASGPEASFNLAYAAFMRGEMDTAATRLTQFLRTRGRDAEALFLLGRTYERLGRTQDSQRLLGQATRLSPRLERLVGQPVSNLARLRTQFNATELRMSPGTSIWNEVRLARKLAAQDASNALSGRRNP